MIFRHIDIPLPARVGVVLANLGTPNMPDPVSVRLYLREFLSDNRVVELHPWLWQPILRGIILHFRSRRSAVAYNRIWDHKHQDSPLRLITKSQAKRLSVKFPSDKIRFQWGMRYGGPSIRKAITNLLHDGCDRIIVFPLYPQYSAATTATAQGEVFDFLKTLRHQPSLRFVPPFPVHPEYIATLVRFIRTHVKLGPMGIQKLVVSFHGLPKAYIAKGDPYADQTQQTAMALKQALGLSNEEMIVTYQSRFGDQKWLQPYTDQAIISLPDQGVTRIGVVTPGFMADCLETLDEIGNEVRQRFLQNGGKEFIRIPCLNDSDDAVDLLETILRPELSGWL